MNYLSSNPSHIGEWKDVGPNLRFLHEAVCWNAAKIPFESLAPILGRPASPELSAVVSKLLDGYRGGCCHEPILLMHNMLAAVGFAVIALTACVVWVRPSGKVLAPRCFTLVEIVGDRLIENVRSNEY